MPYKSKEKDREWHRLKMRRVRGSTRERKPKVLEDILAFKYKEAYERIKNTQ